MKMRRTKRLGIRSVSKEEIKIELLGSKKKKS